MVPSSPMARLAPCPSWLILLALGCAGRGAEKQPPSPPIPTAPPAALAPTSGADNGKTPLERCRPLIERYFGDVQGLPAQDACWFALLLSRAREPSLAGRSASEDAIRLISHSAFHVVTVLRATGPSARSGPKLSLRGATLASEARSVLDRDVPLEGATWTELRRVAARSTLRSLPKTEMLEKRPGGRDGHDDCSLRPTVEECRAALGEGRPVRLHLGLPSPHVRGDDRFRQRLHGLCTVRQPCMALCGVRHLPLGPRYRTNEVVAFMRVHMDASGFVDEVKELDANLGGFTACLSAELMGFQLDDGASGPSERLVPFVFWPADKPGPQDVTDEPASAPSSDAGAPPGA